MINHILQDGSLHVSTYLEALDEEYGQDYLSFEPETITSELVLTPFVMDKIMAGITLKVTSAFWNNITVFEKIALVLNNRSVSFEEYQEISPGEMAWAVVAARQIDPLDTMFSDEVKIYIARKLFDEGYTIVPQDIEFDRRATKGGRMPSQGIQEVLGALIKGPGYIVTAEQPKLRAVDAYVRQQSEILKNERKKLRA